MNSFLKKITARNTNGNIPGRYSHLTFLVYLKKSVYFTQNAETIIYRPQTKFAKVMLSQVSVCPGGCLPHCMLGYTPPMGKPPWTDTRKGADTPPHQADTPRANTPQADTPTLGRHPHLGRHPPADPAPTQCMLGYGQQAGGTHRTGMHSCLISSDFID